MLMSSWDLNEIHEKLNQGKNVSMQLSYLENVDFPIPHEYECIDVLKTKYI